MHKKNKKNLKKKRKEILSYVRYQTLSANTVWYTDTTQVIPVLIFSFLHSTLEIQS